MIKRSNEELPYYILPTSVCRIGRQGCQIIVQDTTVSRHHADLNVIVSTCSYSAGRINSYLVMKDVSKFAQTTVNGHLLTSKQREVTLKPGDVVQFGACPDTFSIDYRNLVACVYDFENRPEYQALAFRTGTPISETIENSALVIADAIETENLGHIQAVARSIPIISTGYLAKLAETQSGVRTFPETRDFEFTYPQRNLNRSNFFRGIDFIVCGLYADGLRDLILSCGGKLHNIDQAPSTELVIVDSDIDVSTLKSPLHNCRLIEMKLVLSMVYNGSIDPMNAVPKVTIVGVPIKRPLCELPLSPDSWITSGASTGRRIDLVEASARVGVKKFKKRHASHNQNEVSLEVWDGKDATRKRRDPSSIPLSDRNVVDDWLDSYSTQ